MWNDAMTKRLIWLGIGLGVLLGQVGAALTDPSNPLHNVAGNRTGVLIRARLALPSAQQALELLSRVGDQDGIAQGVRHVEDTYAYLRAAVQTNDGLMRRKRQFDPVGVADPMLAWENKIMNSVRNRMLECLNMKGYLLKQSQDQLALCRAHLREGIIELETLLPMME